METPGVIVAVAVCINVIILTVQQGIVASNMGQVTDRLESPSPAPVTPAPDPQPVTPTPSCEGLQIPMMPGASAEDFLTVETDFMKMHLLKSSDRVAFFEFDVDRIKGAIQFGVIATNANGPFNHFQHGPPWADFNRFFEFQRSADEAGVDFRRVDLTDRNEDKDYEVMFNQTRDVGLRLQLKNVGSRKNSECMTESIIVDASPYVAGGLFAVGPDNSLGNSISSGYTPSIDIKTAKGFNKNMDFTVLYAQLGSPRPMQELGYRFCVYQLPELKMKGRPADERAGYYVVEFKQFGDHRSKSWPGKRPDETIDPTVRLINRINLPTRESPGKSNEIHYYVDPTVPKSLWQATKKGIENWQPAFDGIKSTFPADNPPRIIGHLPSDDDWPIDYDNADIRFSTISWALGTGSTYAIGMWVNDPRTGEVLKANIAFTMGWFRTWLGDEIFHGAHVDSALQTDRRLAEAFGSAQFSGPPPVASEKDIEADPRLGDPTPTLWALATGASAEQKFKFFEDAVTDTTMHEVGHTLGLRHNMRASVTVSFEDCQSRAHVAQHGLSSSVMDYLDSNFISQATREELKLKNPSVDPDEAYVFTPVLGAYDKWVIEYGYANIPDQDNCDADWCPRSPKLMEIANKYDGVNVQFATDETRNTFDPYTVTFDLTGDPIRFSQEKFKIAKEAWARLFKMSIREDQPWTDMSSFAKRLMGSTRRACIYLIRFLGGTKTVRKHGKGCIKNGKPEKCERNGIEPVPKDDQDSALTSILQEIMGKNDAEPPAWYQKDAVERSDSYGVSPVYLEQTLNTNRIDVVNRLLSSAKLGQVEFAGRLLGETNMVSDWLLAKCSEHIFQIKPGQPQNSPTAAVISLLEDRTKQGVQMAYLQRLSSDDFSSATVSTAARAERARILQVLKNVEAAHTYATVLEKGFMAAAQAVL